MANRELNYAARPLIRGKAIRAKCLDCMCGQAVEIKLCPSTRCALWPWRLGRLVPGLPKPSGTFSPGDREIDPIPRTRRVVSPESLAALARARDAKLSQRSAQGGQPTA
jgi:hypothetical protein